MKLSEVDEIVRQEVKDYPMFQWLGFKERDGSIDYTGTMKRVGAHGVECLSIDIIMLGTDGPLNRHEPQIRKAVGRTARLACNTWLSPVPHQNSLIVEWEDEDVLRPLNALETEMATRRGMISVETSLSILEKTINSGDHLGLLARKLAPIRRGDQPTVLFRPCEGNSKISRRIDACCVQIEAVWSFLDQLTAKIDLPESPEK